MKRKGFFHLLVLLALLVFTQGMLAQDESGTLTIGVSYDTPLFDHLRSGTAPMAAYAVFESLVIRNDEGGYDPWVAESWETAADGLSVTFTLRPGITFHDGTPLDAAAVKWFYDKARDPEGEYTLIGSLTPITDVVVVDDRTVRFEFSQPFASFFDVISTPEFAGLISPTAYEAAGDEFGVSVVVGSGPFRFESWIPSDIMYLRRYDDYRWAPQAVADNAGPANVANLVYRVLIEPGTAVAALETGQVDVLYSVPLRDYPRLEASGKYTFFTSPRFGGALHYFIFNMDKPVFQDIKVRQAINHAIDREGIVEAVYAGTGAIAAYNFLPPHFNAAPDNPQSFGQLYDPDLANQLLDEAGWVDSNGNGIRDKDGQEMVFNVPIINWPDAVDLSQVIQANLQEIGIQVNITPTEIPRLIELGQAREFDILHILWGWPYADIMMNFVHPAGSFNFGGISDETLAALLDAAIAAPTFEERDALFGDADRRLTEQALLVPVVFPNDLIAVSNRVQNFRVNALGYHNFPTDWAVVGD